MGILDNLTDRQFAKDDSGRLVFLPRGPRRPGFFVDSTDEPKIKSLVKIYILAVLLMNSIGSTASIAITLWLVNDEHPASLAHKLKFGLVVYAISASLLYYGPALMMWNVYRGVVGGICSSLTTVDPASIHMTQVPSSRRAVLILLLSGLVLVALGIFIAIGYRH
jgi:hypothetical protein